MKKLFIALFLICAICLFAACSSISEPVISDFSESTVKNGIDEEIPNNFDDNILNSTTEDATTEVAEDPYGNGGTRVCTVHAPDFHTFSSYLTAYVGNDKFMEWFDTTSTPSATTEGMCLYPEQNIYEFIRYFNFPKAELISLYNKYSLPNYNIDLLYNGTADEVEKYYRTISEEQAIEKIMFANFEKIKIKVLLDNLDTFKDDTNVNSYSLIEMIVKTETSIDSVMKMIEDGVKSSDTGVYDSQFEYNFDIFSQKNSSELEKMIDDYSPFYLDCVFCGIKPYDTRYERQVAENSKS